MNVTLTVTAGPHTGREFAFDRHDTFLVGRSKGAHFQLSYDDPYFSRRHFLVEVNPSRVRVMDLNSRNGIAVNGQKVRTADLNDGDELRAGHTVPDVTALRDAIRPFA
jgi:serine/threonine-protein kinase